MKKKLLLSLLLAFAGQQATASSVLSALEPYADKAKSIISTIKGQLTTANFDKLKAAAQKAVNSNEKRLLSVGQQLLPYAAFILNNYGETAVNTAQSGFSTAETAVNTAIGALPGILNKAQGLPTVGSEIAKYSGSIESYAHSISGYVSDISGVVSNLSTELATVQSAVNGLMTASGMSAPANLDDAISGLQNLIESNIDAIKAVVTEGINTPEVQSVLNMIKNLNGVSQELYGLMYYAKYYVNYVQTNLVAEIQPAAQAALSIAAPLAGQFGVSSSVMNTIQNGVNNLPTYMKDVEGYLQTAYEEAGKLYGTLSAYLKNAGISV